MTWRDGVLLAFKGMVSNKLRAILTMLGVIIGVAAVIVLVAIGQGASSLVTSRIETLGTNVIFVSPAGGTPFPVSEAAVVTRTLPFPTLVVPEMNTGAKVSTLTSSGGAQIVGTTSAYIHLGAVSIAAGHFLTPLESAQDQHVAVLGANQVQTLFGGSNPVGSVVMIMGQQFRIIGALNTVGQGPGASQDNEIFIPITVAQSLLGTTQISQLTIKTPSPDQANLAADYLTNFYTNSFGSADAVTVASEDQVLQTLQATRATFTNLLAGTAAIALIVGGIGIMNIMLVSVTERTREIGIRQALGATREDILLQFLLESMAMSLSGGTVGAIIGVGLLHIAPLVLKPPAVFSPSALILAFVFSTAVGLFFGLYPAIKASGLDPIQALRYDG
jgi:putative ABC transport system permease protein